MSERISWLDGWRGIACWLMIVYHLLFDFYMFGWMRWDTLMSWPLVVLEKYIAYSFILCAGISATLTRNGLRRGLITLGAGFLVIAASFMVDAPILFGVLQFLGCAMVIYALVGKWVRRVPEKLAPVLWLVLFVAAHIWTDNATVDAKWLFWLGFRHPDFVSYDYFPILPYIFLFFLGSWGGADDTAPPGENALSGEKSAEMPHMDGQPYPVDISHPPAGFVRCVPWGEPAAVRRSK